MEDEKVDSGGLKESGGSQAPIVLPKRNNNNVVMVSAIQPPPALLLKKPGTLGSSVRRGPPAPMSPAEEYEQYDENGGQFEEFSNEQPAERISVADQGNVGNILQKLKDKPPAARGVNFGVPMFPMMSVPARNAPSDRDRTTGAAPRRGPAVSSSAPVRQAPTIQQQYYYDQEYSEEQSYDQDGYAQGGYEEQSYKRDDGSNVSLPPPSSTTLMFGPPPSAGRASKPAGGGYDPYFPSQPASRNGPPVAAFPESNPRAVRRGPPLDQPVPIRNASRGTPVGQSSMSAIRTGAGYESADSQAMASEKKPPPVPKKQFAEDDQKSKTMKGQIMNSTMMSEPAQPRRGFAGAQPTPFAATAGAPLLAMRAPKPEPEPEPEPEPVEETPSNEEEISVGIDTEAYIASLFENAIAADQLSPEVFIEGDPTLVQAGTSAFYRFLDVASYFSQVGSLRLRYSQLDDNFSQALYEFMSDRRFPFLEVVDLEGNVLTMQGMVTMIATMNIGYGEPANDSEDQRDENGDPIPYQCAIVELNLLNQQTEMQMESLREFEQFVAEVFEKNSSILKFSYKFTVPEVGKFVNQLLIRNAALIRLALEENEPEKRSMSISGEDGDAVGTQEDSEIVQWIKKSLDSGIDPEVYFIDEQDFRESASPDVFYSFARRLGSSPTIQTLQLVGVDLSDKFINEYIEGLKSLKIPMKLRQLVLDYNRLSGGTVVSLIQALEKSLSLREFSAVGQDTSKAITAEQEQTLLQSIERNTSLTSFKIDFKTPASARQVLKFTTRNLKTLKQAGMA
eukprot:TRINITY_DN7579_c0_g1_i2.p1 TRINITY_DN7579_c0_g1~~TRINITY_DN7579_c0_g1_i2.p1  ORF type:complete len:919 (+),score=237.43 TRINITY_DN7579_c0_g1_i2:388-2757(+)